MDQTSSTDLFLTLTPATIEAVKRRILYLKDKVVSLTACINDYSTNVPKNLTKYTNAEKVKGYKETAKSLLKFQINAWREESMKAYKEIICLEATLRQKP